jgi:FdhE protein
VTRDTESKILKKLAEFDKEEGGLPLLLKFYRDLLLVQGEARRYFETNLPALISPDAVSVRERPGRGVPLLDVVDLNPGIEPLQPVFARVREIFQRYPELTGSLPDNHPLTAAAVKAWFKDEPMPPPAQDGADEATFRAMVHVTFKPLLEACAEALASRVDPEKWRRRDCPVCGGMGYLDRERGSRWLLCSRCDFTWLFHRLQCPYCGNVDQNALAFFTDEKGLYRLDVCERCKCYLKTIDLRKTDGEVLLPLERLLTTDMDRQAREKGYRLPA